MGGHRDATGDGGTILIEKIYGDFYEAQHFAAPVASSRTSEFELVRGVLHILQGLLSNLFFWDDRKMRFCAKVGVHVSHLSTSNLRAILVQFSYAASCLKLVDVIIERVNAFPRSPPPTLRAFVSSISSWVLRLRDVALRKEAKIIRLSDNFTLTLLGLTSSLSSVNMRLSPTVSDLRKMTRRGHETIRQFALRFRDEAQLIRPPLKEHERELEDVINQQRLLVPRTAKPLMRGK